MTNLRLLIVWVFVTAAFMTIGLIWQYQPYRTPAGVAVGYPYAEKSYIKVPMSETPAECVKHREPFLAFPERRIANIGVNAIASLIAFTSTLLLWRSLWRRSQITRTSNAKKLAMIADPSLPQRFITPQITNGSTKVPYGAKVSMLRSLAGTW